MAKMLISPVLLAGRSKNEILGDKSVEIKYTSFKEERNSLNFEFNIKARGLKNTTGYLSIYREGLFGYQIEGLGSIVKISNGTSKVYTSVSKSSNISGPKNNFFAIIVVDGVSDKSDNFNIGVQTETGDEKYKKIKIVLDPGHGYTKGNTGAVCFLYKYKVKGQDGSPQLDSTNNPIIKEGNILNIPSYVINDPDLWIISKKEDPNHNERILVFDVASKLKTLLEEKGFTCFITRNSRVVSGNDDVKTRMARIDLANKNNADYFISIHADGAIDNNSTGAHVIYPKTPNESISKKSKELAKDIFNFYNVVNVEKTSPKEDVRGLQVLGNSNHTTKKILVELGFVTTPKDANSLFSNIDRIAQQLFDGIMLNIKKYY